MYSSIHHQIQIEHTFLIFNSNEGGKNAFNLNTMFQSHISALFTKAITVHIILCKTNLLSKRKQIIYILFTGDTLHIRQLQLQK